MLLVHYISLQTNMYASPSLTHLLSRAHGGMGLSYFSAYDMIGATFSPLVLYITPMCDTPLLGLTDPFRTVNIGLVQLRLGWRGQNQYLSTNPNITSQQD